MNPPFARIRLYGAEVASHRASGYSVLHSVGECRSVLPPKAQIHPKTLRQKNRGTGVKPETLESDGNCCTLGTPPQELRLTSTDGANLSGIEDRGVKRKFILTFHPFSVSRNGFD